jgi:RNA polymerase nonessential primary-like sigma factor
LPRDPEAKDVAEYLNRPVEAVERMLHLNERMTSLDSPVKLGSDQTIIETIADEGQAAIPDQLQHENVEQKMTEWLGSLSPTQQEILTRRFGLGTGDTETLEEVAGVLGVPRERVRQMQNEALRQLRTELEEQGYTAEILFH